MLDLNVTRNHIFRLIDKDTAIHSDEHLVRVLLIETQEGAFWRVTPHVFHWVELAVQVVCIANFAAQYGPIAIDRRKKHVSRVQVSTQDALFMLVKTADLLSALIQVPKLDDRVQTSSDEPLAPRQQNSDLVIVSVEVLYHSP